VTSKVGIFLRPNLDDVKEIANDLAAVLRMRRCDVWIASAWDLAACQEHMPGTDLLICIGGDGTVLRGARAAIPHPVRILAVNVGRLGFLSELSPEEAPAAVLSVLDGAGRIEERTMVAGEVCHSDAPDPAASKLPVQYALNDIVVGRYAPGRPIYINVVLDGEHLETVRADGMIVSTATGSTGYNLSAGGPVLFPESRELLITPVAAHLSRVRPLVLPAGLAVELRVETDHRAVASFDGQMDEELEDGACVRIQRAPHVARLVRLRPPTDFYRKLIRHLDEPTVPPEYPDHPPADSVPR
jgi:NAD+ kinase